MVLSKCPTLEGMGALLCPREKPRFEEEEGAGPGGSGIEPSAGRVFTPGGGRREEFEVLEGGGKGTTGFPSGATPSGTRGNIDMPESEWPRERLT
mmetsp:Transcript_19228/g.35583  ORF Transcript_19228/g.35583 Transcript_19228/m.35583 type:complete len:95 (-) Transcript_19228:2251-2535(-)